MDYSDVLDTAREREPRAPTWPKFRKEERHASMYDYAINTGRMRVDGQDVYIGEDKLRTPHGTVKDYMLGAMHGNSDFADKFKVQQFVHSIYRTKGYPSELPFHMSKRQRAAAAAVQKRAQAKADKWIDSLNDDDVLKLGKAYEEVSKRHK